MNESTEARPNCPELDAILGQKFPVLDDGFVRLIDYMGDESSIVQAARVSFGKGTKTPDEDAKLIRYLFRHRHTSPFEMTTIKFHLRLPIFVMRQLVRHRTGSLNEQSGRYMELGRSMAKTETTAWRLQSKSNKQGSDGYLTDEMSTHWLTERERILHEFAWDVYQERLKLGVAREQARKDLPLSLYCYDASTEVLTNRGFIAWPSVTEADQIAVWDPSANSLFYEHPEYLTRNYYKGAMYRVDHRGVDLLVTPHHKMYVDRGKGFELVPAQELGDRCSVRYTKAAPYYDTDDWKSEDIPTFNSRALLSLFGFFIGDGCSPKAGGKNELVFTLRRPRKIQYLSELCKATGLVFDVRGPHFLVRHQGITKYFRDLFYDSEDRKRVPEFMLRLNKHDSEAVLCGLRNSDGCSRPDGAWRFDTTSPQVADAAVILGVHAGCAVNTPKPTFREKPSSTVHHVFFFGNRMAYPSVNHTTKNTSWEPYDGYVYCAKTRTGILVVRRNGKVAVSGNTECYWEMDLHNLLHFLRLRMAPDAQEEIREYANVIGREIVARWCPVTWGEFEAVMGGTVK